MREITLSGETKRNTYAKYGSSASKQPVSKDVTQDLYQECLRRGLVAMSYSPTIRINPPLVISEETALEGLGLLEESLAAVLPRHGLD